MKQYLRLLGIAILFVLTGCQEEKQAFTVSSPARLDRPVYTLAQPKQEDETSKPEKTTPRPPKPKTQSTQQTSTTTSEGCPPQHTSVIISRKKRINNDKGLLSNFSSGSEEYQRLQQSINEQEASLRRYIELRKKEGYNCNFLK